MKSSHKILVVGPTEQNPKSTVWWADGRKPGMLIAECVSGKEADHICVMLAWHYRCQAVPLLLAQEKKVVTPKEIAR